MTDSETINESKTVAELEALILTDLLNVDGCPQQGIKVTVYGNPWNAVLSFSSEAGPVCNKDDLKLMFEFFAERLQRVYDIRIDSAKPV